MLNEHERLEVIKEANAARQNSLNGRVFYTCLAIAVIGFTFFTYYDRLILGLAVVGSLSLPLVASMERRARYKARMIYEQTKPQAGEANPES